MTRSSKFRGCTQYFPNFWVLNHIIKNFMILRILVIFGRSGALFEARSWEEVGRMLPTSNIYKPEVLGSLG
jgi:hypothetical protein